MIIGIDGNEANIELKVGVNQYAFEILWGLYRLNRSLKNKHQFIIYLKDKPNTGLPPESDGWNYKIIPGNRFWILRKLTPYLIKSNKPDIYFSPSHYLPLVPGLAMIFTIHDLGYLIFSDQFKKYDYWQLKYWTAISIYISKYIICVSETTKKDIVRHYPYASNKTVVVYHGHNNKLFNPNISENVVRRVKNNYKISSDYILFLSTLKPSKNIEGLIKAYSIFRKKRKDVKLVIAGKKGWLYESVFQLVKKLKLDNNVIFTDYVSEQNKAGLIKGAKLYILPSFWEGFGMDVVNSMACGTPVVLSSIGSLPEIAGDAGIYVDPYDTTSLVKGIEKVFSMNSEEYNILIKRCLFQAKKYSWNETARETLSLFERINNNVHK